MKRVCPVMEGGAPRRRLEMSGLAELAPPGEGGAARRRSAFRNAGMALVVAALALAAGPARGATPEDMLREADQAERGGAAQKAAAIYKDFIARHPDHTQVTEAHYRLAKCFDSMGMVDESVVHLKKVLEGPAQFRNRPDAAYMLGRYYGSQKDYDNAIATFEKMLREGAGLYEDEALNLCGGYYAIREKTDEAAAKFNILKRKQGSPYAEQAAYKLTSLWLKSGQVEQAVDAIQDFAQQYPDNRQIPELLLRAADGFRLQKAFDKTIALCDQIKASYPKAQEALAAGYMVGLCHKDRGAFQKAADVFDGIARAREFRGRGLAAEALLQAAELYFGELKDPAKALSRFEEAAKLARDSDSERKSEIQEVCYFRLAEHHYAGKRWGVALEYYLLLRGVGTKLNILGRILQCQQEMDVSPDRNMSGADMELLKKKIADNPGTAAAADAEIFILDRKLADASQRRSGLAAVGAEYEALAGKYPREVLAAEHLDAYIWAQAGTAYSRGESAAEWAKAVPAFEKAAAADPTEANPYRVPSLEGLALAAERAGDKARALKAYNELFAISKAKLDARKTDVQAEADTLKYLKSLVTRSDTKDLVAQSLDLCRAIIREKGELSDLSREARFYIGELCYVSRDFSAAAKAYQDFISIYGPRRNAEGDFADGPWKPAAADAKVGQAHLAALRIAHSWYLQGHEQNMLRAYEWMLRNVPDGNPYIAEARYWVSLEMAKGKKGETREGKLKAAQALWTNVVSVSLDFDAASPEKSFHPWARPGESGFAAAGKYVKSAMLKCGQWFGEGGQHEPAARIFALYLDMYAGQRGGRRAEAGFDEMEDTARYALGRECIALRNIPGLVQAYRPYVEGQRESRFRVSALRLLGYHAGQEGQFALAADAYATLLDEYGSNKTDAQGRPAPVPQSERLRARKAGWDGIRLAPPKDFDAGEIRFALGFLHWRQEEWGKCAETLAPFADDPQLAFNKSRDRALFMTGQSRYRIYDYAGGVKPLVAMIREYPKFEAIDEVYVHAARGLVETKDWAQLDLICRKFADHCPRSDKQPRMELYAALSLIAQGKADRGVANLRGLEGGDTYEDVKADAAFHLGLHCLAVAPPKPEEAIALFEKSAAVYPRETSCLEAGKCYMRLRQWSRAQEMLDRVVRDFPQGDRRAAAEARGLMPEVQKELARQGQGKGKEPGT